MAKGKIVRRKSKPVSKSVAVFSVFAKDTFNSAVDK